MLDLPTDLLSLILGQTQWSARRTCRALLDHQSAGRTSFRLRWGTHDLDSSKKLTGLLAQLPRLEALECIDTEEHVRDIGTVVAAGRHPLSLELCNFLRRDDISPIGGCSQLLSLKVRVDDANPARVIDYVDLRPLSACTLLTDADLQRFPLVRGSDLSPLVACTHLELLHFADYSGVTDASPLSSHVELASLRLGGPVRRSAGGCVAQHVQLEPASHAARFVPAAEVLAPRFVHMQWSRFAPSCRVPAPVSAPRVLLLPADRLSVRCRCFRGLRIQFVIN